MGAVSHSDPKPAPDAGNSEMMNPMIGGQAMLPDRDIMENMAASPDAYHPGGGDEGFRRGRRA